MTDPIWVGGEFERSGWWAWDQLEGLCRERSVPELCRGLPERTPVGGDKPTPLPSRNLLLSSDLAVARKEYSRVLGRQV